ncbi:MAG TPA: TonB-dependent receptor [Blastocatellia bacterium]|nr:TonB-dependent receptor [Blastocatellia bacterium]
MKIRVCTWLGVFIVATIGANAQSLTGRVADAGGASIGGAGVVAHHTDTGSERATTTDAEGRFELAGLAPGSYRLVVTARGFAQFTQTVALRSDQGSSLEIHLSPGNVFETVTITSQESGYQPLSATTGSRIDIPLRDVPASVQVVTRQVIDDQAATNVQDVIRNVSGVNVPHSTGSRAESFTIRGFSSIANTYRDGYRNDFNSNRSNTELSNVERVEVLKGPASVLFGRLDPSGVVNFVTKKPLTDHYYSMQFQGGSFRYLRPQLDFSGPINREKTGLYRLNVAYENAETFRDFNERERFFIAPSVSWIAGPATSILIEGEFLQDRRLVDRGLVALPFAGGIAPVPISRYLGDPGIPYNNQQGKVGLTFNHGFSPVTTLRSAIRTSASRANYDSRQAGTVIEVANPALSAALRNSCAQLGATVCVELGESRSDQLFHSHYWQNDLATRFSTGRLRHTFVGGFDIQVELQDLNAKFSAQRPLLDIFNPTYVFPPNPLFLVSDTKRQNEAGGLFVQDLVELTTKLKVTISGRFDYYKASSLDFLRGNLRQTGIDRVWTPRAGIVYQPAEPVSLYFSYSRSFQPVLSFDRFNNPFVPERGEQFEGGLKLGALHNRLTASIAAFNITRRNVATTDPVDPQFSAQVGEVRSRGFEFDGSAQLARGWNLLASFAYIDATITRDTVFPVGNRIQGVAKPTGSFWTTYEFAGWGGRRVLKGLGAGAGLFGVGRRFGDGFHSFSLPGYLRVDATAYYKLYHKDRLRARLAVNVNNLLGKLYYEGVQFAGSIIPGAPRNALASVQVIF